jgi:hypothetical protein
MGNLKIVGSGAEPSSDPELQLYFDRAAAAELVKRRRGIDVAPKTLTNWAWEGKGPRWTRFGRRSVAKGSDILAAVDAMLTDSPPPQAA